jgi:hypothetical protein
MKDVKPKITPIARSEDILVEPLDEEALIYDLRTHEATCLNASAALIRNSCDGQRTIEDIVDAVGNAEVTEHHVADILDQLRDKNLLEVDATLAADRVQAPTSRRSFLGHAAAASLVLPAVMSTIIPTAAEAVPQFTGCNMGVGDPQCNDGPPGQPGNDQNRVPPSAQLLRS